jgi:hypothetical protein
LPHLLHQLHGLLAYFGLKLPALEFLLYYLVLPIPDLLVLSELPEFHFLEELVERLIISPCHDFLRLRDLGLETGLDILRVLQGLEIGKLGLELLSFPLFLGQDQLVPLVDGEACTIIHGAEDLQRPLVDFGLNPQFGVFLGKASLVELL